MLGRRRGPSTSKTGEAARAKRLRGGRARRIAYGRSGPGGPSGGAGRAAHGPRRRPPGSRRRRAAEGRTQLAGEECRRPCAGPAWPPRRARPRRDRRRCRGDSGTSAGSAAVITEVTDQSAGRDHLRPIVGSDRVPQLDDRQPGRAGVGEPAQLRARGPRAARSRRSRSDGGLPVDSIAAAVADRPHDRAGGGRREVVVGTTALGHVGEQPVDGRRAGRGSAAPPRRPRQVHAPPRFRVPALEAPTRPAVSSTRGTGVEGVADVGDLDVHDRGEVRPSSHSIVLPVGRPASVERVRKAWLAARSRKTTGPVFGVDSLAHGGLSAPLGSRRAGRRPGRTAQGHAVRVVAAVLAGHVGVAGSGGGPGLITGRSSLRAMLLSY